MKKGANALGTDLEHVDAILYDNLKKIEQAHWWFVGRRAIVRSLIDRYMGRRGSRILEAGCGTGGNLALLSGYGEVSGFEIERDALAFAQTRGIGELRWGALPHEFPFGEKTFDLVVLLDVLEHIKEDEASLALLHKHLEKDGRLILTVPALPSMWSHHDETHHHFRRYTRHTLRRAVESAGFEIEFLSYYNCFLLPVAWLDRFVLARFRKGGVEGVEIPSPAINRLLGLSLRVEEFLLRAFRFPVGLSLVCIAKPRN